MQQRRRVLATADAGDGNCSRSHATHPVGEQPGTHRRCVVVSYAQTNGRRADLIEEDAQFARTDEDCVAFAAGGRRRGRKHQRSRRPGEIVTRNKLYALDSAPFEDLPHPVEPRVLRATLLRCRWHTLVWQKGIRFDAVQGRGMAG